MPTAFAALQNGALAPSVLYQKSYNMAVLGRSEFGPGGKASRRYRSGIVWLTRNLKAIVLISTSMERAVLGGSGGWQQTANDRGDLLGGCAYCLELRSLRE